MNVRLLGGIGFLIAIAGLALAAMGAMGQEVQVARTLSLTTTAEVAEMRFSTSTYSTTMTDRYYWVGEEGRWHEVEIPPWHYVWYVLRAGAGDRIKGSILVDHGLFAEFSLMDREAFEEYRSAETYVAQEGVRRRKAIINIIEPKVLKYMPKDYQRYYKSTPEGNRFDFEARAERSDYYYALLLNSYKTHGLKVRFKFYVESERATVGERTLLLYITTTRPTTIERVETVAERRAGLEDPRTAIGLSAVLIGAILLAAVALRRPAPSRSPELSEALKKEEI